MSSLQPSLRREQPGDQPFLVKLYASTREAELDAIGIVGTIRELFLAQQFQAQSIGYATSFPSADRWIILNNDEPVGRMMVSASPTELRLVDIAVLPSHQRQGIGTRLVRDLQSRASRAGLPLRLSVLVTSAAEALYRRLGFHRIGSDGVRVAMEWLPPAPDPETPNPSKDLDS